MSWQPPARCYRIFTASFPWASAGLITCCALARLPPSLRKCAATTPSVASLAGTGKSRLWLVSAGLFATLLKALVVGVFEFVLYDPSISADRLDIEITPKDCHAELPAGRQLQ